MPTEKGQNTKGKFKNIFVIIIALVCIMLVTTIVSYFVAKNIAGSPGANTVEVNKNYTTYPAGEFLTNLSDKGYIKISIVYLLSNKNIERELEQREYEVKDKIYSILRSKTFDSVKDSEGMEDLRVQIKEAANKVLGSGKVEEVYFTSIIVN